MEKTFVIADVTYPYLEIKDPKERLIDLICDRYKITIDQVRSKTMGSRRREITVPRHLIHWILLKLQRSEAFPELTQAKIGSYTARDHATVLHSFNTINNWRETNKSVHRESLKIIDLANSFPEIINGHKLKCI